MINNESYDNLTGVSVCIPVYNGAKYISQTLDSILSQTHKNIEIVISDNGSTDSTIEIICSFACRDSRIRILRQESNLGYCNNIWAAVSAASNEIIAIYHADDIYHPEIIAKELMALSNSPQIGGVFCQPAVFTDNHRNNVKNRIYLNLEKYIPIAENDISINFSLNNYKPIFLEFGNIFACPSFMTKKTTFMNLGGFTDTYPSCEDLELWIKYLQAGFTLSVVNEFLLYYRISSEQVSATYRKNFELAIMYRVLDTMLQTNELNEMDKILYRRNKAIGYIRAAKSCYNAGEIDTMYLNILKSRDMLKLPMCTPYGFIQTFPRIGIYMHNLYSPG